MIWVEALASSDIFVAGASLSRGKRNESVCCASGEVCIQLKQEDFQTTLHDMTHEADSELTLDVTGVAPGIYNLHLKAFVQEHSGEVSPAVSKTMIIVVEDRPMVSPLTVRSHVLVSAEAIDARFDTLPDVHLLAHPPARSRPDVIMLTWVLIWISRLPLLTIPL